MIQEFYKFIGKTLSEARMLTSDNVIRVVKNDGKNLEYDTKYCPYRVNVEIENGLITKIISFG